MRVSLLLLLASAVGFGSDGAAIFQNKCAVCHRAASGTRAPLPEVLRRMQRRSILTALENGLMKQQGASLSPEDRAAVAAYLGAPDVEPVKESAGVCSASPGPMSRNIGWNGWGADLSNSRFQSAAIAGIDIQKVPKLKIKWAFGFPGASSAVAQPTVVGGRVFMGSEDGTVYSLDARSGCIIWKFKAQAMVRAAVSIGEGRAFFGDVAGNIYALNAESGELFWKTLVDPHPAARITGAPLLYAGLLYVPVSSGEEGSGMDPAYPCCTFRGSVVAIEIKSGKQIWKSFVIPETPQPTRRNSKGTQLWGPSGAAVWSAPTLDVSRNAVYVAVGNSYSDPPSKFSDAVLAFDMNSGKLLWSRQITAGDQWNLACINPDKTNCPPNAGDDVDFGASPILKSLPHGHALIIVGQKSGVVSALDPDMKGKIVWQARIGRGGLLGGIEWGGAADERSVYFPLSDFQEAKPEAGGGLFALRIDTGAKTWYAPPARPACLGRPGCNAAQIAPATVIPGVVFSGSMDGHLRAYSTTNGTVIWDVDTLKDFPTVNGVAAHGGSLNATGPTIAEGMLYLSSGYGGIPGNVLLAFSVDGK